MTARIIEPTRIWTVFRIKSFSFINNQPLYPNGYDENDIAPAALAPVTEGQARKDNALLYRFHEEMEVEQGEGETAPLFVRV